MSKLLVLGYNIYVAGILQPTFILDENQADFVLAKLPHNVGHEDFLLMLQACKEKNDDIKFEDIGVAIEVVRHDYFTPRYVILEGLNQHNKFFSVYTGEDGYNVECLHDGTRAYRILKFADSIAEAQNFLFGAPVPSYAVTRRLRELQREHAKPYGQHEEESE